MKKTRIVCLIISIAFLLPACTANQPDPSQAPTWQEQYDLGVRYLSDGDYEGAILAFSAAIEIDPKRAPAYVGRGDAYVKSGETEENLAAALVDYEKAFELDPDPEIEKKIQQIRGISTNITADENGWYKISDFFEGPEILTQPTMGDKSFQRKTFADVVEYYGAVMDKWYDDSVVTATAGNVTIQQLPTSFEVRYMAPTYYSPTYEPEYLGIHFGDSFDQVLQTLGITEAGARYLKELNADPLDVSIFNSVPGIKINEKNWCFCISVWCDWSDSAGWCITYMYFDENGHLDEFHIMCQY